MSEPRYRVRLRCPRCKNETETIARTAKPQFKCGKCLLDIDPRSDPLGWWCDIEVVDMEIVSAEPIKE